MENSNWIVLPGGIWALHRFGVESLSEIPLNGRQATIAEVISASHGYLYPWGNTLEPQLGNLLWNKFHMGLDALSHKKWFVCSDGRIGGAENVLTTGPGAGRYSYYVQGGLAEVDSLSQNEVYGVCIRTDAITQVLYGAIVKQILGPVGSGDAGRIIMSPVKNGIAYVGFTGRCAVCPNQKHQSFEQLQKVLNDQGFNVELRLFHEWEEVLRLQPSLIF